MRKMVETRSLLSNTIKDTSTIVRNPLSEYVLGGVTPDCASILDSIAKKTSCFHYFSHGASLHHCSFSRMIFALVSCIFVELAPVARMRKPTLLCLAITCRVQ